MNWRQGDYDAVLAATRIPRRRISLGNGVLSVRKGVQLRLSYPNFFSIKDRVALVLTAEEYPETQIDFPSIDLRLLPDISKQMVSLGTMLDCFTEIKANTTPTINLIFCAAVAEMAYVRVFRKQWTGGPRDLVCVRLRVLKPIESDWDTPSSKSLPKDIVDAVVLASQMHHLFRFK